MRRSLSTELMLSAALALCAGIVCVFALRALIGHFQPSWMRDRDLARMASHIAAGVVFDARDRPTGVHLPQNLQRIADALPSDVFYEVLDAQGRVLLASNGDTAAPLPPGLVPAALGHAFPGVRAGLPLNVFVAPVVRPIATSYVLVARSDRFDETLLENEAWNARMTTASASAAALGVFAAVVFVTVRRLHRRLSQVSAAAARISPANLKDRLAVDGMPRELVPLIESFNLALARLEDGFRLQQDFLATAAHELKTPLALIRGEIELDGRANRAVILADLDHMGRQVHQLLHLAEVSDASSLAIARTDVGRVVRDAADFIARLAQARGIAVRLEQPDAPLVMPADAGALFVLVRNLVENAAHHAPDGSEIVVRVDAHAIAVRDRGPGIPAEDLPNLFKRFWRGAHRRDDGAGLGLAICSEVARGHGWGLAARNLAPTGAEFVVSFGRANSGSGQGSGHRPDP